MASNSHRTVDLTCATPGCPNTVAGQDSHYDEDFNAVCSDCCSHPRCTDDDDDEDSGADTPIDMVRGAYARLIDP